MINKTYWRCQAVAFWTIASKETRRFLRIWIQTLLPTPISIMLYFFIFGELLGSRLSDVGEGSYVHFITPGLLMLGVINNAFNNVVSSFFISKFQRSLEEILVAPVAPATIILAFVIAGIIRGLLISAIVLACVHPFLGKGLHDPLMGTTILFLTGFVFAQAGLMNGIFAKKFDEITIVPTFILTPLIYLGGVFYELDALPLHLQRLVKMNPIYHMIEGFRATYLGFHLEAIRPCLFVLFSLGALLMAGNLYLLSRKKSMSP